MGYVSSIHSASGIVPFTYTLHCIVASAFQFAQIRVIDKHSILFATFGDRLAITGRHRTTVV
jgi:succinate dehydrogenase/fumarate reductase cytochrome b subunit